MQYPLDYEIRDHLAAYLASEISLHDFEEWFFPKTWNVDSLDDPALIDLVYEIKLDWAEFSNGDWTEEQLRDMLRPLVENYKISVSANQAALPNPAYSTSSKTFEYPLQLPLLVTHSVPSVDIRSSTVYG